MDIYDRINKLLNENNKTRKQMAKDLSISYHTINSLYARRTERIPFDMVQTIAHYLGTTADYLAFGERNMNESPITDNQKEFLELFSSLTEDKQKELISYALFLKNK